MTTFLEASNLIAATIYVVITILVVSELRRLSVGYPPVVIAVIVYFVVRVADVLGAPDPLLGYSPVFDAVTDVAVIALLLFLLMHARRIVRLALATVNEAEFRLAEYERARHDYAKMVHAELAGPLSVISGAAQSLHVTDDPEARERLATLIEDSSSALRKVSEELDHVRQKGQADPRVSGSEP